jgi:hypothetical protein
LINAPNPLLLIFNFSQPSPQFQLNIQHGGAAFDKSENKGNVDYTAFIKNFDHYPWMDEINKANTISFTKNMAPGREGRSGKMSGPVLYI